MARQIVWSGPAERDRKRILAYWLERNGSAAYSLRLFHRINTVLARVQQHPFMGRPTDVTGIRVVKIDAYLLFYEVMADAIVVHHLWHEKRDLEKLKGGRR